MALSPELRKSIRNAMQEAFASLTLVSKLTLVMGPEEHAFFQRNLLIATFTKLAHDIRTKYPREIEQELLDRIEASLVKEFQVCVAMVRKLNP